MSSLWVASMVLQWLIIAGLMAITLSLVRQLGLISVRLNPSAGLDTGEGPGPGTEISAQDVQTFPTGKIVLGGERSNPQLIVFLSSDCSMCTTVAAHARAVHRTYATTLDLLVVVLGTPRVVREFVEAHELSMPITVRQHFPSEWAPDSTPYGISITREGTVAARGVPNALEHLEEMIEAAESGAAMTASSTPREYVWGDALPTDGNGAAPTERPAPNVVHSGEESE